MRCKEASLLLEQGAEFATTRMPPLLTRPAMRGMLLKTLLLPESVSTLAPTFGYLGSFKTTVVTFEAPTFTKSNAACLRGGRGSACPTASDWLLTVHGLVAAGCLAASSPGRRLPLHGLVADLLDDVVDTGLALALAGLALARTPACQCRREPLAAPAAPSFPHSLQYGSSQCSSIVVICSTPTSFETH